MDIRFLPHNTHWSDPERFRELDPHLRLLDQLPLVHRSGLLSRLPWGTPGIYSVSGGRQVGKTTLLKQWMTELLSGKTPPKNVVYLTGELVDDHHSLVRLVTDIVAEMPSSSLNYIIFDEVTYVKGWDKGVKYLADIGLLENVVLVITGSDLIILKESRMRFPGRRGKQDTVDFHLFPLNFFETIFLKTSFSTDELDVLLNTGADVPEDLTARLFDEFQNYLTHGGFLSSINDMAQYDRILPSTFATYSDWIRGDILKRNKREPYLLEIVSAMIRRYGSQVTWNNLSQDLSIDHPMTVADYVGLLSSMDAVFIQSAIREDKLTAAPKKAKKLMFSDPFIFHALNAWAFPSEDPFGQNVRILLADENRVSKLVETCAVTLYRRHFPTYYIKAKGEVDIAYVDKKRFFPIEIKWTRQVRPGQLKQIRKYNNGKILTQQMHTGQINGIPTEPLPLALLRLDAPGGKILSAAKKL